ncbi:MAG: GDP-mannose 4,6-dehydratase [Planctomycetota bacterium]|nr:GDP-mannose 4,6-dehydratase [Planctomycetota bacterium]
MPKCCLVTGAAGFIGSHLVAALLEQGDHVVGVDNFDPFYDESIKRDNIAQLDPARFTLEVADLRNPQRLSEIVAQTRPDLVVHIAAMAGVRPSIENPRKYAQVNIMGLANLLQAMREAEVAKLLFASSSSVYGNNTKIPFAEDDPVPVQISPYAATKRAGELLCETWARLYGIRIGMLRFFTVYGPRQRPDLAIGKFMRLIADDQPIPMFGDGSTSRDYTYIDDIVDGILRAAHHVDSMDEATHRLWNLGNSRPVELTDMIQSIGRIVGRTPRIETHVMQTGDVNRTYADITRSRLELGYEPTIEFEDGLRRQWEWMKERI